jgi:hypothetical protein
MMRRAALLDRYSDYFLLAHPRPAGGGIGSYGGHPIPSAVIDEFGQRYVYVGLAPRRPDGGYDTAALGRGEWIVPPGLVYRCEHQGSTQNRQRSALLSWLGGLGRAGPRN